MTASRIDPLLERLAMPPFRPRAPWWGGDLQTLRDTLRPVPLPPERGVPQRIPLPGGEHLLGLLDPPLPETPAPLGLVVALHGLGGSSEGEGVRRLGWTLQREGFAVLRLNLRGAGGGRDLAGGSYAAQCNRDLLPALRWARRLAGGAPLLGAGLSLGGTVLLNAQLEGPLLDGLVAVSSPLDLAGCCARISQPRNRLYQSWLLGRLRRETLADPAGLTGAERRGLAGVRSIRDFDALITAPRWGYSSVEEYYAAASPQSRLRELATPTLLVQALDDPWVPADAAVALAESQRADGSDQPRVLITPSGGHNGFHAPGGCWADRLAARWLRERVERC
jgi:predicted alpha/beta-fold hydrolase